MKRTKRLLALFLSLMLLAALAVPASADYDYAANAKIFHTDYTGKTVILHTNDVHGASRLPVRRSLWWMAGTTARVPLMSVSRRGPLPLP